MSIQLACEPLEPAVGIAQKPAVGVARYQLRRPKCPRCGSILLIAEESAFNWQGHINHFWSCDGCAHEFVTAVPLRPF